jgi:hypothetical protein
MANLITIGPDVESQPLNDNFAALNDDIINIPHGLYRNAIINGNFDVWQRATSVTNPAHNTYPAADRWKVFVDGSGFPANITHSRQVLDSGDIPGSYYFYRISVDGPGTTPDLYRLAQFVEHGTRYLCGSGKKVTVSFWARSSIPNKRIGLYIRQDYGFGGTPSASENINGFNWSLTSVWTKYTATFTTNTLAGKTFGTNNDDYLSVLFVFAWSSTFMSRVGASTSENFVGAGHIDIAQVQLNAGDVALPFQPRSIAEELALCERYYEKSYNIDTPPGTATDTGAIYGETGNGAPESAHFDTVQFRVRKRSTPTVIVYGTGGTPNTVNDETADRSVGAGWFAMPSETGFRMNYTLQNATSGRRRFHYVADAEL